MVVDVDEREVVVEVDDKDVLMLVVVGEVVVEVVDIVVDDEVLVNAAAKKFKIFNVV